ncbi:MAG: phosphoesterase [Legionellales bacterium]|nr:phosphoesterase [Legionellales bacterium]
MAGGFKPDTHWRDSARHPRFFLVDARAAFPLLLFLLHIRVWTAVLALIAVLFFALLEKFGFTMNVFLRWLRATLAGPKKISALWWSK